MARKYIIKETNGDAIHFYDDRYECESDAERTINEYRKDDEDPSDPRMSEVKYEVVELEDEGILE